MVLGCGYMLVRDYYTNIKGGVKIMTRYIVVYEDGRKESEPFDKYEEAVKFSERSDINDVIDIMVCLDLACKILDFTYTY